MSDAPQYIITPAEAATLTAARQVLKAIDDRVTSLAWNPAEPRDAFDFGKISEAADIAASACFNVLNVTHAYGHCQVSGNAIDLANGQSPRYPAQVSPC